MARGKQRYKHNSCHRQFQGGKRLSESSIWSDYVYGKLTLKQLADKYDCSSKTIQRYLKKYQIKRSSIDAAEVVVLLDTTYWKRNFGVMLFKDAYTGNNLLKFYVKNETNALYLKGIFQLFAQGFIIKAVVCDGRMGLIKKLGDMPVQMCQFHQLKIVQRYISKRPKSLPAQHLWLITNLHTEITVEQFKDFLAQWFDEYQGVLNERKINEKTGKSQYAHKRLRSAYKSLKNHQDVLFTYQAYPELAIPNTSNKIEGSFAHLK